MLQRSRTIFLPTRVRTWRQPAEPTCVSRIVIRFLPAIGVHRPAQLPVMARSNGTPARRLQRTPSLRCGAAAFAWSELGYLGASGCRDPDSSREHPGVDESLREIATQLPLMYVVLLGIQTRWAAG